MGCVETHRAGPEGDSLPSHVFSKDAQEVLVREAFALRPAKDVFSVTPSHLENDKVKTWIISVHLIYFHQWLVGHSKATGDSAATDDTARRRGESKESCSRPP